jgi:hypothetical protein
VTPATKLFDWKTTLAAMSGVCSAAVLRDFRVLRFVLAEILAKLYDAETADNVRRSRRLQVVSEELDLALTELLPAIPTHCDFVVCD